MKKITRKPEIREHVSKCLELYNSKGVDACVFEFNERLLKAKVKFPLLEYSSEILFENLSETDHIPFCDKIESLKTIGGNVILGKILQLRLPSHFNQSVDKATEYISYAHVWYICDIIGERVFGYSLLVQPEKTMPEIKRLSKHKSNWVIRSLGAGGHYSIKKGLDNNNVNILFTILLTMANTKDKEIRQGVGWAAKTTAKFHPDIIERHKSEIENTEQVANWFRKKIEIGLNRNEYAKRNNS